MKHIRFFKTVADFNAAKDSLARPNIGLITETGKTYVISGGSEPEVEVIMISDLGYQLVKDGGTQEYVKFMYDKEIEYNSKTYYAYGYYESGFGKNYIMVPSRNFSEIKYPFSDVYMTFQPENSEEISEPVALLAKYGEIYGLYGYNVEPENKVIIKRNERTTPTNANGHAYVDLGLTSGTLWATRNIDTGNPWECGKYFAWGETEGYYDNEEHDFSWGTYKYGNVTDDGDIELYKYNTSDDFGTVDNKFELELSDDAAHVNMGGDWKMPTAAQIEELFNETNHEWVEDYEGSGVAGRVFTSKTNCNTMFIPASSGRWDYDISEQGVEAFLWSSTLRTDLPSACVYGYFNSDYFGVEGYDDRSCGFCVRGILECYPDPSTEYVPV